MIDIQKSLESEIVSINELTEILKQIYTDKLTSFLVIKKIENIPVFSWFETDGNTWNESKRFYYDEKFCFYQSDNNKRFKPKEDVKIWDFDAQRVFLKDKDCLSGTTIGYNFDDIVLKTPEDKVSQVLYLFIYEPIVESFWKQDMKYAIVDCVTKYMPFKYFENKSFEGYLNFKYSNPDMTKKDVKQILGINDFQLKLLKDLENNYYKAFEHSPSVYGFNSILASVKYALGKRNISSFSNEQSEIIFNFIKQNSPNFQALGIFVLLRQNYSLNCAFKMIDKVNTLKSTHGSRYYYDYLDMVKQLHESENFGPDFRAIEDIERMHDEITEIYAANTELCKDAEFDKRRDSWKKWEYSDNDFSVVIPRNSVDLSREGLVLNHCVSTYVHRILEDKTNIVFIRKNEEINKPYFTVEISNYDTIEQVHGKSNSCVEKDSKLEKFVNKWAKEKNLILHTIDKIR